MGKFAEKLVLTVVAFAVIIVLIVQHGLKLTTVFALIAFCAYINSRALVKLVSSNRKRGDLLRHATVAVISNFLLAYLTRFNWYVIGVVWVPALVGFLVGTFFRVKGK